jgi:ATP-dependent Clp protease, protease subunit
MSHGAGSQADEIYGRLLKDRIVFIGTAIDDSVANLVIAQMLFLEAEDPGTDMHLYVNSPGGATTAGMAIYDTMQAVRPDVQTLVIGQAHSMAAILLAAGARGKRFALPESQVSIQDPRGGRFDDPHQAVIAARELERVRDVLHRVLVSHTGQPLERIAIDSRLGAFMNAAAAKAYGIVDAVIPRRPTPANR